MEEEDVGEREKVCVYVCVCVCVCVCEREREYMCLGVYVCTRESDHRKMVHRRGFVSNMHNRKYHSQTVKDGNRGHTSSEGESPPLGKEQKAVTRSRRGGSLPPRLKSTSYSSDIDSGCCNKGSAEVVLQ